MAFAANLVAPNLEVFHWDMTLEDQQCGERFRSFGQPEEDWLREFAAAARDRKSSLSQIQIEFNPETYLFREDAENPDYPWDRMDSIARDIKPYGIELSYKPPNITRGEFWEQVKERQRPEYWDKLYASFRAL